MRKPVEQMSPEELQEHFTADDLKAMAEAVAGDPSFDPAFRDRITKGATGDPPFGRLRGVAELASGSAGARAQGCSCSYRSIDPECRLHGSRPEE